MQGCSAVSLQRLLWLINSSQRTQVSRVYSEEALPHFGAPRVP